MMRSHILGESDRVSLLLSRWWRHSDPFVSHTNVIHWLMPGTCQINDVAYTYVLLQHTNIYIQSTCTKSSSDPCEK